MRGSEQGGNKELSWQGPPTYGELSDYNGEINLMCFEAETANIGEERVAIIPICPRKFKAISWKAA